MLYHNNKKWPNQSRLGHGYISYTLGKKPKFQAVTLLLIATLFMAFASIAAVLTYKCLSIDSDDDESQSFDE